MERSATARVLHLESEDEIEYHTTLVVHQELVCRWHPDTTLTHVNQAYCSFYRKHEEDLIGKSILLLVSEHERQALEAHIRQLVTTLSAAHPAVIYEHPFETAQGEIRWQEWVDRALFDASGQLLEFESVGRDITERKLAEDSLRATQKSYEILLSNLPGLVYRCRHDEDWSMEFASEGCLALTGYSSDDFVVHRNISWMDLVHPDDLEAISNEMGNAIREQRSFELVYRIRTASGELKWVWEQGCAIFEDDGSFSALEGFINDITEKKQAEQALFERKGKAIVTLSSIGDAVITTDPKGFIEYLNPAAEDLTGWSWQEAKGRKFSEVCRILNEQTRAPVENDLQNPNMQRPLSAAGNTILKNRYGLEYTVEDTVSIIPGTDGTVIGIIVVFRYYPNAPQARIQCPSGNP